jgi:peptidyl-prolyl cis-trans isomerase SurA
LDYTLSTILRIQNSWKLSTIVIQDSIVVTDAEVKGMVEDRLSYMVEQIGSLDKVVKYYKKDSEEEFRTYFRYFERRKVEFRNAKENCRWCRNHPRSSKLFQKIPAADLPFLVLN